MMNKLGLMGTGWRYVLPVIFFLLLFVLIRNIQKGMLWESFALALIEAAIIVFFFKK